MRCSRPRLEKVFLCFKFTPAIFYLMSLMVFGSLINGINRLISKGVSNIYWKGTIEKEWRFQNFDFLKNLSPGQFLENPDSRRHYWILNFLLQLKNQRSGSKNCVWFFYNFNFERNYDVLKAKSPPILTKTLTKI